MKKNWNKMNLGEIATFVNGYSFKPSDWKTKGIPIIRIQNLNDENASYNYITSDYNPKYEINKGDILISWSASLGVYKWEKEKAVLNQHIFKVLFNKIDINKDFFVYLVSKELNQMLKNVHGSTMKHITKKRFDSLKVEVPPLEIQKKIVYVLDRAQEVIDLRKKQIDLLDNLIQSTFYEMFGDPVTNPKGFNRGIINDLTHYTQYGTSKKADENNGNYPILRMNNITYKGNWDFEKMKFIELNLQEKSKYLVYKGELLFNRTNSKELVGKTAVYKNNKPMCFAGYLVKLVPNDNGNSEYISGYLNSKHGKLVLLNMAKSIVGMANINAEELKKIKILLPPIELQNEFAKRVEKIEEQREQMTKSLKEMENNYNSLIQRAFKGELFEEEPVEST